MDFATWEPVYRAILADFGYDRAADERARDLLGDLVADPLSPTAIGLDGATVAVAGGAATLAGETGVAADADAVVAASTAVDTLREAGVAVDCMVTDLDKNPGTVRELAAAGTPVVVHAHGDNAAALRTVVPALPPGSVLPTTQAAPRDAVANFGGFTDGDRAAFLADHLGADSLRFPGWDFEDPTVGVEKRRKLGWAERLLFWLERRRGETFPVHDGRRGAIDTTALPL